MSNNLVPEPIQSMQMAQLESIVNNVDSSGQQMEMGLLGSGVPVSQQLATLNDHVGMSGSQGLPTSIMQSGQGVGARPSSLGMTHLLLPQKHSVQMGTMPDNMGPQQLSTTPKRKVPMEFSSGISVTSSKRVAHVDHRPWLQEVSNTSNKGSPQMQSQSNASKSQHLAAPGKKKTQMESTSSKPGTPRSSNSKSQNAQIKQTSKVQTESSETVRSKMRVSLAAALALVSQQAKPLATNNNTLTGASNTDDKLTNCTQGTGSASTSIDTALEQKQEISQSVHSSFTAADSVDHVMGEQGKGTTSNENLSEKCKDYEAVSTNVSNNESILSSMQVLNCDKPDFESSYTLTTDDVPFSDSFFVKDDLLQGNGLSWVISDMMDMEDPRDCQTTIEQRSEPEEMGGGFRETVLLPELLASRIEEELFKLFGGVNKKYKEKGRSLLFNLKDRNNPELRERVMSGEIPPEQLCSMTAEELASKELSQWRIAKAEEHEKMVVLPDSDVDIRRLVKKTHKGEFQVEVEHEDNVPVEEVSGGTTSVARNQRVKKDVEASSSPSKPDVVKGDISTDGQKSNLQKDNPFSITISSNDGSDPMEGLMTDDALKDPDFLPPIVSLDEFMESLDSEPPFANLPGEPGKVTHISDKDDSKVGSKLESSDLTPTEQIDVTPDEPESKKLQNPDAAEEKRVSAESGGISSYTIYGGSQADIKPANGHTKERSTDEMKPASSDAELRASQSRSVERSGNNNTYSKTTLPNKDECFWEGMLQVNSNYSVISIFKSGEKTSARDWPGLLEIKGRVRLDSFEKFLQELRLSRSRAIMVLHFVSKGSSPNNEQSTIREVADSYIVDERVGFAEPVHGVELYFCPPHKKTVEMLSNILPKEQIEAVNSIDNGLIGVIVWRKTNLTTTSISPTTSSHHKDSFKRQNSSRRQQDTNVNAHPTHKPVPFTGSKPAETGPLCDDDDVDVPPGFGPPGARVEDDLPEFNFSGSSNQSHVVQKPMGPSTVPYHSVNQSHPAEQMRELVHKYGQNKVNVSSVNWQDKFGGTIQPWNDDDDDIPEWQPQNSQNQFPTQQTMHNFHLRPQMMNQSFPSSHQQPLMPTQYLQPPMNVTHGQLNFVPHWNPSAQGNNLQPSVGHPYGVPRQGQDTTWPQNVSRSRGF